jgi:hypothetical protein
MNVSVDELVAHLALLPRLMVEHLLHLLPPGELDLTWQASVQRSNVFDRFHSSIVLERSQVVFPSSRIVNDDWQGRILWCH